MSSTIIGTMENVLADTYTLYLKAQNYHWNITGPNFRDYHLLLQDMYEALAIAVDEIAEQIRIIGRPVPATFDFLKSKTCLKDPDCTLSAKNMLMDLLADHQKLFQTIMKAIDEARTANDVGTEDLLIERVRYHTKTIWFLKSICQ
jgi:starvation-inducible DNA-binding protein